MRRSEAFLPTSRAARVEGTDAAKLLTRAGLVRDFGSGLWGFAPAGERVRRKLVARVRSGMESVGGQRVALPALQYRERWVESGRWDGFEGEMFTLENRDGQAMCLAPSHEEGAVHLVEGLVRSHADLPLLVYQVTAKHRDDHARNGLVRCKEFTMKDAYSFHRDERSLAATYRAVRDAYGRVLSDLGLEFAVVEADAGVMGGSTSEEFVAPVDRGSDRLRRCTAAGCRFGVTDEHPGFDDHADGDGGCPRCGGRLETTDGVEVGHVFRLGTRYSEAMGLTVDGPGGREHHVLMGSYGLGVDRTLQALLQQHADGDGCRWPVTDWGSVAPYRASIVPVRYEGDLRAAADDLHAACEDVLLFDGSRTFGERLAESDLLGVPAKVILGDRYRETGRVELETRGGETTTLAPDEVPAELERFGPGE